MNNTKKLLIGTHNQAKFKQMKAALGDIPYECVSLSDMNISHEVDETGSTYYENAYLKATIYAQLSGLLTLADDSGLEIDALEGAPGVFSSRYAGANKTDEEKIAFILDKMKDVPEGNRQAKFCSVIVLATPDGQTKSYSGESTGFITTATRGPAQKGFPYYLIYALNPFGKTMAELHAAGILFESHRQKSLAQVKKELQEK
jgi:XTP/dITP diphosphohydrolase